VRIDDTWKLLKPLSDLADREHLNNLISDLNSLEVEAFVDAAGPSDLGLSTPEYHLTILRTEGRPPFTLAFGDLRQEAGSTQVACLRDDRDLFWVDNTVRTRVAKAPVRWRSKIVFPFDTWDVERLAISAGDTQVVTDRSDGLWRLADSAEANYSEVQERLTALSELEAENHDLVTPVSTASGRAEISFKAEDDGPASMVTFSFFPPMAAGGRILVTVSDRNTVMSVDPAAAAAIFENPLSLKQPPEIETSPVDSGPE